MTECLHILRSGSDELIPAPDLMTAEECARYLRLDLIEGNSIEKSLAYLRSNKLNPIPYLQIGQRIRYISKDMPNWIDRKQKLDKTGIIPRNE